MGKTTTSTFPPNTIAQLRAQIAVDEAFNQKVKEAQEWCALYSHGRWTFGTDLSSAPEALRFGKYDHVFRFKGRADALMFKLTYGGR